MHEAVFYLTGDKNVTVSREPTIQDITSNNKDVFTFTKENEKLLKTLIKGNDIIRYSF